MVNIREKMTVRLRSRANKALKEGMERMKRREGWQPYEAAQKTTATDVADLDAIAQRLDSRESINIEQNLDHVWAQADDLLIVWRECERLDKNFQRWVNEHITKFKYKRACHYLSF